MKKVFCIDSKAIESIAISREESIDEVKENFLEMGVELDENARSYPLDIITGLPYKLK